MIVRKRYLLGGLLKTGAKSVYKANKDSIKSFMKDKFGDRFNLFIGDSRTEMKLIDKKINQEIDLIHIDGGHSYELADIDLSNSINISKKLNTKFILLDDTDVPRVRSMANKYIYFYIMGY